ncbi:hypothetical protein [Streptomyces meridianus]|uniref:Transmembrane protein n=1 Tax=Streptomyces meridianus TaxID=2938945 RepID=A0ABT0XBY9_9ACTN|nr:hypothetical protein [Streptomyces meridianus]MCM2580043.1 hypothetical protein [Streptomyces meridianus]
MRTPTRWRHLVLGLGFLGLAGVRAAQDASVWALVFVLAAGANAWLAVHEAPRAAGDDTSPSRPDRAQLARSLEGFRTSARQWQVLGAVGVAVGGGLLFLEPWLAVFAAAAALFALRRAHRAGRSATTLRRAQYAHR